MSVLLPSTVFPNLEFKYTSISLCMKMQKMSNVIQNDKCGKNNARLAKLYLSCVECNRILLKINLLYIIDKFQ